MTVAGPSAVRTGSLSDPVGVATHERLAEIVRLAPIGVGIVDRDGHTILSNDALCGMLGYTPEEFSDLHFEAFTHPDDVVRNNELFDELMSGRCDHFEMDKRFFHKDGHVVWARLQVSSLPEGAGEPMFAIGLLQDITEQKRLQEELQRLAFHDPLTGLANRRLFQDRLSHQLRRGSRRDDPLGAMLFVDVDEFKRVNDTLGHHAGDAVLVRLAERIRDGLRPGDTAARLGGDEFAVLLEQVASTDDAVAIAERLKQDVEQPLHAGYRRQSIVPSVSIGVALLSEGEESEEVLREADLAMYRAKASGAGRIVAFGPELLEHARTRLDGDPIGC